MELEVTLIGSEMERVAEGAKVPPAKVSVPEPRLEALAIDKVPLFNVVPPE